MENYVFCRFAYFYRQEAMYSRVPLQMHIGNSFIRSLKRRGINYRRELAEVETLDSIISDWFLYATTEKEH